MSAGSDDGLQGTFKLWPTSSDDEGGDGEGGAQREVRQGGSLEDGPPEEETSGGAGLPGGQGGEPLRYEPFSLDLGEGRSVDLLVDPTKCCGGHVWPAGICLAKLIQLDPALGRSFFQGKRVIELGAGTGIVGLAAAALGASVVLTDQAVMLDVLQENATRLVPFCTTPPTVREYNWGDDISSFLPIDYVLAADVLYHKDAFAPLTASIKMFKEVGAPTLIGYVRRWKQDKRYWRKMIGTFKSEAVSPILLSNIGVSADTKIEIYWFR